MQRNPARVLRFCLGCAGVVLAALFLNLMLTPAADAQVAVGRSLPMVTQPVNERNLVVLAGNTRPEAVVAANDQGIVTDDRPLPHLMLQLRRPAAQERALVALIDQLHDRKSANYHHWLTAAEIGERFSPAASDIAAVTGWLSQHGFAVNTVYTNGMVIDFSGTAGQIRTAFHTEIHNLLVDGAAHIGNISDPQIPAALAPVVVGIVSLHDFMPHPTVVRHVPKSDSLANFTSGGGHYITPGDIATIYNFKPLFAAGVTGNQRIDIVENSDLYSIFDWVTFRSAFGIPQASYPHAALDTLHPAPPSGSNNCSDPGANAAGGEATLDAEYASAAAPNANIVMEVCADVGATWGVVIAIQNLVNGSNPPAIMSISYSECEPAAGASLNAMINTAYQTGVGEGMSIYVSAGDWGAAACQIHETAYTGINVNALASTPYNVAVGGTDFSDTYNGTTSSYWNSTNAADYSSAKSYIPEIPWNSSCGSQLLATYRGFTNSYGTDGFCNDASVVGTQQLQNPAGSGGPSGCATGAASISGVVSGTCVGYAKPSWQSFLVGVPNDGARDLPDVSLFAGNGIWGHYYIYCWSDPSQPGTHPCTGAPSGWSTAGGTSISTPIWAGIQALINQSTGDRQGNPNYGLYQIAATEYGVSGRSTCNSSNSPSSTAGCVFYDVTAGDIDVPCTQDGGTSRNCYLPSATYGVLSLSNSSYTPAYKAGTGWDFATGIGTVNVANLVGKWSANSAGTHDFDSGGKSDILFRNTSGAVGVWLMNGGSVSSSGLTATVANTWAIIGQRDFDGDSKADLLWRDSSGNLAMWFMSGLTVSSTASLGNVSPAVWTVYGTSDMNGDGMGDILWRDTSGNVAIWFMNGSTISSTVALGMVSPSTWSIVGSTTGAIVWRDTSGNLALWRVNGATVQSTNLGAVPSNWVVKGVGDFNGDGNLDLLFRDSTSGTVAMWFFNRSGTVQSTTTVSTVSNTWTIVDTGDYNGDGRSDILWTDASGNLAIWFMLGSTVTLSDSLGNVGTSWAVQSANAE